MKKYIIPIIVMLAAVAFLPQTSVKERVVEYIDTINPPPETTIARVKRIVDGDTIELRNGDMVRLIGIDAPESKANSKAKRDADRTGQDVKSIKAMGKEVTSVVKQLLHKGDQVLLEFDTQKTDRYGRLLAYVYRRVDNYRFSSEDRSLQEFIMQTNCESQRSGSHDADCMEWLMINAELVFDGYAQPMTITPNIRYSDSFKSLHKEARRRERGFWDNRAWRLDPKNQNPVSLATP